MQLNDGTLVASATDLVGSLACDHLVSLELGAARGQWARPHRNDPELDLIQRRGYEHEAAYLDQLEAEHREIHSVETSDLRTPTQLRAAEAETVRAMEAGKDVIYQATFFDGRWRGHADFLLRVDKPSRLGDWSYEVADTKLSRRVKAAAILQMCLYSERLAELQGREPDLVHVVTGDRTRHSERLADYAAYYRAVKSRFEERVFGAAAEGGLTTYPEPVDHCRVCRWYGDCADQRRRDDHLSLVAGITRTQRRRLTDAGIETRTDLGTMVSGKTIRGIGGAALDRVREQARVQLRGDRDGLVYELIAPSADAPMRGLALLPEASPGDVFFDMEADPWALEGGLEYLFGVVGAGDGEMYEPIWAHDREQEKRAFEQFIDAVMARLRAHPGMHVYHYAAYEPTAIKRLMGRHATREDEVDHLLRGGVFVDLFQVVRQGIRASVESYSIKQIEKLAGYERTGPITQAGFSVVEYERWVETRDPAILDSLADYNRDDCVATRVLRDWLEARRADLAHAWGIDVPRPTSEPGDAPPELTARQAETHAREDELRRGVPADAAARTTEEQGRWLLAALLDWHRREAKPQWWAHYRLREATFEELFESPDALAGLRYEGPIRTEKRSTVHRYTFDIRQEWKFRVGDKPLDPEHDSAPGEVVAIDAVAGTIDLKRGTNSTVEHPRVLIPGKPIDADVLRDGLGRVADAVIADGFGDRARYGAAFQLLLGEVPRVHGEPLGSPLVRDGEAVLDAARRLGLALEDSCLPIQGPPGSGKTFTGAHMIVDLLAAGRRVGITASTHKAVTNLVDTACRVAAAAGVPLCAVQRVDEDASQSPGVEQAQSAAIGPGLADGRWSLAAGTPWLFARSDMDAAVDVLFVDEAGQMSLASVICMAGSTRSIVLLGDPNQLPQVSQGAQPEGADASALEHVLDEAQTMPPDRGLFLDTTYRLHPDINAYISDAFYEGRLEHDASTARQRVLGRGMLSGTGIRFVPIPHFGNQARSVEEAEAVAEAVRGLIGRRWVDKDGNIRTLTVQDVLVVAPYNAHVAEIVRRIGRDYGKPNVGTVDKFQGQEAPAAIYSMATSTPEDAPRQMEFLYSAHRLNVAISRARGLAVLVCSPELLKVRCHTPAQMRLANVLCRFVEMAALEGVTGRDRGVDQEQLALPFA